MFTKQPYRYTNYSISETGTVPAPQLSLLLCSRRGTVSNAVLGDLDIPLYTPFMIPGQYLSSGSGVLSYLQSLGATVARGISNTINLVAPTSVSTVAGNTVLTWSSQPAGWTNLINGSINGTVSQAVSTATGTILTISQMSYSITLSAVTGTFNTTNVVSIAYINAGLSIPDGKKTEIFALDVYYAVMAMQLPNTLNLSFSYPETWITIVSDRDANYSPNATPLALGVPDSVVVNPDTTVSLFYDAEPTNWIYVPETALGATTFNQATSLATGTFVQQLAPEYTPTGSGFGILLNDVTGTFNTTNIVSMTLDDSVSVFTYLDNKYFKFVQTTYEITTNTSFNTTNSLFVNYINSVNAEQSSNNNQYGTTGVIAVSSIPYANYTTTAQPNSDKFVYANRYYPNRIGDVYIQAGQLGASLAGALASNLPPYNLMNGIGLNGLPVSSDDTTWVDTSLPGGEAEQLLQWGQTPIATNKTTTTAYIVNPITTQVTIPGSSVVDQEFYDVRTAQVVNETKYRINTAIQAPQFLNRAIDGTLLEELSNAVYMALKQEETETMIFGVDYLKPTIQVLRVPTNAHAVSISLNISVTPAYTGTTTNIYLTSALIVGAAIQA